MKFLVLTPCNQKEKEELIDLVGEENIDFSSNEEENTLDKSKYDVVLGNPRPSKISEYSNLKWLQVQTAGVDWYLKDNRLDKSVKLTNCTGAYGLSVSEHILSILLALIKNLEIYTNYKNKHQWKRLDDYRSIDSMNILVLGLGNLGKEFSKRANALGAKIIGMKRNTDIKLDYVEKVISNDQLYDYLPWADCVVNFLPSTKETYNIINKESISKMKDGVIFLNGGRGSAVDEEALVEALKSKKIYKAAIDVAKDEPLSEDSPLWDVENLMITPHTAGNYILKQTKDMIFEIFKENIKRYLNGEELKNVYKR